MPRSFKRFRGICNTGRGICGWVGIPKSPADAVYQNILVSPQMISTATYVCQEDTRNPRIVKVSSQNTIAAALRASASYRAAVASSISLSFEIKTGSQYIIFHYPVQIFTKENPKV